MKDQLNLINVNKTEIKKREQDLLRAGLDPNPDPEDDKCACLCSPGTDRGWKEVYKANQ